MSELYEMEEKIMNCWNIIEDLKTINAGVLEHDWDSDNISNAIQGLVEIYQLRFDDLFRMYERVLASNRNGVHCVSLVVNN